MAAEAAPSHSVSDFDVFIKRCTEAGITNLPLIRLNEGWKDPAATTDLQLPDKSLNPIYKLTVEKARDLISHGINVGCYGSKDGIEIHDIDLSDGKFVIPETKILELIATFDTLTVMTRSGGYDLYFKNSGLQKNPHIYYDGESDAGERRANWQYAVAPGSFVQKDKPNPDNGKSKGFTQQATGLYKVINDAPIREFDVSKAPEWYVFEKKKVIRNSDTVITLPYLTDKKLVEIATRAENGPKFSSLMQGSTAGYPSESEADMALASILAFYTRDETQIQRIMRESGLNRDKWNTHQTYLYDTIDKAVSTCKEHYSPGFITNGKKVDPEKPIEEMSISDVQKIREQHIKSFGELPELPEGFFHDYMEYGKRMTYAYPAFHFAGALTLVSMVCGRRVVVRSTAAETYVNTYIMCIGPTSISGKSTANDKVSKFFSLIRQEGSVDDLPKKMSPQGLLQRLSKIPCRYWAYDECSEFFGDSQAHWGEALESNLCSIYDGRASGYGLSLKKKEDSEWNVKDVFVSCLWNTTDSGIEEKLQYRSVSSGLVPRFMWFWMQGDNLPRENRSVTQEDLDIELSLQRKLWALRDILMKRPLNTPTITFKVNSILEKWMLDDITNHREKDQDMHRVCTARLFPQAYKMAMMFSLMDTELQAFIKNSKPEEQLTLSIPDKYAELAKKIAEEYLRPRLEHVINLARFNDSKNYQDQIRKSIEKHGTVATKSQIIRDTRIPKRNLEEALETMVEGEVIKEFFENDGAKGRKSLSYALMAQSNS